MHRSRRQKVLPGALAAALSVVSTSPASATEPGWADRLLRGTSAGDPSTLKTTTVVGLYGVAAASIATGVVFTLRARDAGNRADDYFENAPAGFCGERASPDCHRYLELRRSESTRYLAGEAFLGGGVFLLLSGALVAELWPNQVQAPKLSGEVGRDRALLGISAQF
jgi:hypothetical protein